MKYLLFVSFCYKHYKKENSFRVYVDDLLVDEASLTADINRVNIDYVTKNLSKDDWLRRDLVRKSRIKKGNFPLLTEKLWLYTVDIEAGHCPKIKLDFSITDNNYTNGFMTKGAMARVEKVGLIPLDKFLRLQTGMWHEQWGYYKAKRLRFSELYGHRGRGYKYPTCDHFIIKTSNQSREQYPFDFNWDGKDSDQWIGENFSVIMETMFKHKTLIFKSFHQAPLGIVEIDPVFLLMAKHKDVINIYNEDHRSNNP